MAIKAIETTGGVTLRRRENSLLLHRKSGSLKPIGHLILGIMSQYTENEVNQALEAISNGQSVRKAAQQYGVPRSTLQHRLQGTQARAAAFSDLQRLTVSQEAKLAEW
ncbi:hypothetical protein CH063_08723, partial [Colletotrichum higginsianum]